MVEALVTSRRESPHEGAPETTKPLLSVVVVEHHRAELRPERRAMVAVDEMHELVGDHVLGSPQLGTRRIGDRVSVGAKRATAIELQCSWSREAVQPRAELVD